MSGHPDAPGQKYRTSTEWQRLAARRLYQSDLSGAIDAMEQAVAVDPNNFHHWMWLRTLYEQADDSVNTTRCAGQGLRCLDEAPNPSISPEERTRLVVRASIPAGKPDRAADAVRSLYSLRRSALDACEAADCFGDWYERDVFAAPVFETLLELQQILGDPDGLAAIRRKYRASIERGIELARQDDASDEEIAILHRRRSQLEEGDAGPEGSRTEHA